MNKFDELKSENALLKAACSEMRNELIGISEYWNGTIEGMHDAVQEMRCRAEIAAYKTDCGKGWLSPEQAKQVRDALENAPCKCESELFGGATCQRCKALNALEKK